MPLLMKLGATSHIQAVVMASETGSVRPGNPAAATNSTIAPCPAIPSPTSAD